MRVFYDEAFRLPLSSAELGPAIETRRADDAVHYLLREHAIDRQAIFQPEVISYEALGRVHTPEYLDAFQEPATLAHIFAVDASDVVGDELLRTVRLGCGGTVAAAHSTLETGLPGLNTFGGFHHAAPDRGAGFCAVNDMAVAIAALRAQGFSGRVGILDFDFHPPDGTSACLGKDPSVWLGSISGTSWGQLEGVDETVLPEGAGDTEYLAAVGALLSRMPQVGLVFVLAGADVLAGDRLGTLALSLGGVRRRDLLVAHRLAGLPQVWLPSGGYSTHAWKVLAGVGLVLAFDSEEPIPLDYDPLASRMNGISRTIASSDLGDDPIITEADVFGTLGGARRDGPHRLLNFYTPEGLEYALERYGLLPLIRRLGFSHLHVVIDRIGAYDRARLLGLDSASGQEGTLIELEVERRRLGEGTFLFINWLSLRNPRAAFSALRPQLPGQEVPGLGLAREMTQLLGLMAKRLVLDGVAFRPSWYHMAFAARHGARFVTAVRQGQFEALMRDLRDVPLLDATRLVADGRVTLNDRPWKWEADEMVRFREVPAVQPDAEAIALERDRCRFAVAPA